MQYSTQFIWESTIKVVLCFIDFFSFSVYCTLNDRENDENHSSKFVELKHQVDCKSYYSQQVICRSRVLRRCNSKQNVSRQSQVVMRNLNAHAHILSLSWSALACVFCVKCAAHKSHLTIIYFGDDVLATIHKVSTWFFNTLVHSSHSEMSFSMWDKL